MPSVLRILARMNVGGPARHVLRIAAPLRAAGWDSVLVTGQPDPGEGDLVEQARAAGEEVIVVPALGRSVHPWRDRQAYRALRRLIADRRPDLVHTHTAKAGVLGRLAAPRVRSRRTRPLPACLPPAVPSQAGGLPARGSPARGSPALVHTFHGHVLSGYFSGPTSWLATRLERRLARRTDRLIAVSAAVRDELLQQHGVGRAEQYAVIPPGFDTDRTAPDRQAGAELRASLGWRRSACVVGVVGRLAPVKNVELLLESWPAILAAQPDTRLLVVGDGPSAASLRARLAGLSGVATLGWQPDLGAVYGALDLFALPSRAEGLPQAVAEALCAGVPVVATAVGGVPELVRHGVDGVLVAPDSGPSLQRALIELIADAPRRAAFAAAAVARTWDAHSATAVAQALGSVYAEVTDTRLSDGVSSRHAAVPCTSSS